LSFISFRAAAAKVAGLQIAREAEARVAENNMSTLKVGQLNKKGELKIK